MSRRTFWKVVNPAIGLALESMDRARLAASEPRRSGVPKAKPFDRLDPMGPAYRGAGQKRDDLVDDAWERMERDRKAEEAERESARVLVDAMVRAAESEPQGGSDV